MGWPKGKLRKPKEAETEAQSNASMDAGEATVVVDPVAIKSEGVVVSDKNSIEEMSISVMPGQMPALISKESDPFSKFKTEPDKFAYRAINSRATLRREREAQGWQPIAGAEYGDLVLAKIPKAIDMKMKAAVEDKTRRQSEAIKANFKETAANSGVKTFEEH